MKTVFEKSAPLWFPQTCSFGFEGISNLEQTYLLYHVIFLVNEICCNVQYAKICSFSVMLLTFGILHIKYRDVGIWLHIIMWLCAWTEMCVCQRKVHGTLGCSRTVSLQVKEAWGLMWWTLRVFLCEYTGLEPRNGMEWQTANIFLNQSPECNIAISGHDKTSMSVTFQSWFTIFALYIRWQNLATPQYRCIVPPGFA